jgi:hypothetical protein
LFCFFFSTLESLITFFELQGRELLVSQWFLDWPLMIQDFGILTSPLHQSKSQQSVHHYYFY